MIEYDHALSHGPVRTVDVGTGPAIVLIHGLGGSWRNWELNLPGLAEHHRVVALDLPGFGCSAPYDGPVTMQRYVDTVVELLEDLKIEQAIFVGNSMGGLLTIEAAARHPERVVAAVLVDSGGIPLTSAKDRFLTIPAARLLNRLLSRNLAQRAVARSSLLRHLIGRRVFHDPSLVPPDLLRVAVQGLGARGFGPALAAAYGYDARTRTPHIGCPVHVLWGRQDLLLPVSMGHELHRLISDSTFEIWEQTGHCPMIEDPRRFNELMARFAAGQSPPTAAKQRGARP